MSPFLLALKPKQLTNNAGASKVRPNGRIPRSRREPSDGADSLALVTLLCSARIRCVLDESKSEAQRGTWKRRSELLQRVHQHNRQLQEEPANGRRSKAARATADQMGAALRDSNIELINIMMEALEQEHEFL